MPRLARKQSRTDVMSEKQRGMHWKRDGEKSKGVDRDIFSFQIDKEIIRKRDRLDMPEIEGEYGSEEWWGNLRDTRNTIKLKIEELNRVKGGGERYQEQIRKWTELLLRLDKMIGDATGVFFKDNKAIQPGGVNNFIVVMPNQQLEKKTLNVAVDVIDTGDVDE